MLINANGNVGIGTTAPSDVLSVSPIQYNTGTASQSASTTVVGSGTTFTSAMVGSQFVYKNGVSAGTITGYTDAAHITVSNSLTVASQGFSISYTGLQVSANGKVGIGTTAPAYTLSLGSNTGLNYDSAGVIGMWTGGTGRFQINGNTGLTDLNNTMWVQGSGNVGIGTTTPGAALEVDGSLKLTTGSGGGVIFADGTVQTTAVAGGIPAASTGTENIAIGQDTLSDNSTGSNNTAIGFAALDNNSTGYNNTAIGSAALGDNSTGSENTAIGEDALNDNSTGGSNAAMGQGALYHNTAGNSNTATGVHALYDNTTGSNNTAFGWTAGAAVFFRL